MSGLRILAPALPETLADIGFWPEGEASGARLRGLSLSGEDRRECRLEGCRVPVEARRADYLARLLDWQGRQAAYPGPWADFLLRGPGESGTAADEKRKEAGFS